MNAKIETVEFEDDDIIITSGHTMKADLMGTIIDTCKGLPDTWQKMSQEKQQDFIDSIEKRVTDLVEKCVRTIASDGRPYVYAKLDQVTFKGSIEAKIKIGAPGGNIPEGVLDLAESTGQQVMIIVPQIEAYEGSEDELPTAENDQPDLLDSASDPLYDDALEFVQQSERVTISALQRELLIGYSRAARLMNIMVSNGYLEEVNGIYTHCQDAA